MRKVDTQAVPPAIEQEDSLQQEAPARREHILDAAKGVFLQHGYGGTSMEKVAKVSGVARRTLYNQFESKDALFEAMIARMWTRFPVLAITEDAASLQDPYLGLTRLGKAVADFWVADESVAFLRMIIAEGVRFPDLANTFFEVGKEPAMQAVKQYVRQLARKYARIDDVQLATRQFLGLIDEPLLWVRVIGKTETFKQSYRDKVVENAVSMFLGFYARDR